MDTGKTSFGYKREIVLIPRCDTNIAQESTLCHFLVFEKTDIDKTKLSSRFRSTKSCRIQAYFKQINREFSIERSRLQCDHRLEEPHFHNNH